MSGLKELMGRCATTGIAWRMHAPEVGASQLPVLLVHGFACGAADW